MRRGGFTLFVPLGIACIIAGGALAGFSAPAPSELASWAAAYLVLVAGLAQVALGLGQGMMAPRLTPWVGWLEFVLFNLGNAGVLAGTAITSRLVTNLGGGALFLSLVLFLIASRSAPRDFSPRWVVWLYRVVLVVVALGIPIGLTIGALKSG